MIIRARNTLADSSPKSYLTHPEVAGTTVFRWSNPNAFQANWAIQVGETGEERTEIVLLSSSAPSGTLGTLNAVTLYDHPADTPLYAIKYDKLVFERSTAGTTGTATPMTDGTITITPDSTFTQFDDTSGSTTYGYRTYFRNSLLAVNSTESGWITSSGFSQYSLGKLMEREKEKLWNASFVSDDMLRNWNNEWLEKMSNAAISVNEDYLMNVATVTFSGTTELGTITASDFKQVRRVWYTEDGANTYQATKMEMTSYFPQQIFTTTHPFFYMKGDTVIGRKPNDNAGTFTVDYYAFPTPLQDDTDALPNSLRTYTKSFVDYCLAQAYAKDGKTAEFNMKMGEAMAELDRFKREASPRNKTGPTYIDTVESVSELNSGWYF